MDDAVRDTIRQATTHLQRGEPQAAIQSLRELGGRLAESPDALYLLGLACGREGQFDEAATYLSKALELKPNLIGARYNLALALKAKGSLPKAIAQLKEILRQDPQHDQTKELLRQLTGSSAVPPSPPGTVACPKCGTANAVGYVSCTLCGALSAEALKRKADEAAARQQRAAQAADAEEGKRDQRTVLTFYTVVGAIAAASLLFEVW